MIEGSIKHIKTNQPNLQKNQLTTTFPIVQPTEQVKGNSNKHGKQLT